MQDEEDIKQDQITLDSTPDTEPYKLTTGLQATFHFLWCKKQALIPSGNIILISKQHLRIIKGAPVFNFCMCRCISRIHQLLYQ